MIVDCVHASETERPSTVECDLQLYGGRPHIGLCRRCEQRESRFVDAPMYVGGAHADNGDTVRQTQATALRGACDLVQRGRGNQLQRTPIAATKLLLRNFQSPGDVLMLTAAVRDLHRAAPGRYMTAVQTACSALWHNNPNVVSMDRLGSPELVIDCNYPLIHQSNQRPLHFIHGFAQDLERRLGIQIPVTEFKGDVHLSALEKTQPSPLSDEGWPGRYWIIMAGGKYDFTAKWWSPAFYQEVVDYFRGKIQFVQCGESGHWHPPLRGVINLVGKSADVRKLIRLVYHADGVVCPITFAMHLSAAIELVPGRVARGCVVIAGGREPTHWEMYPGHQFLHTQGALECCATGGCWKSRCQPVSDGDAKNNDLCTKPVIISEDLRIPKCMHLITPRRVIDAIELYYQGGAIALYDKSKQTARSMPNAEAGASADSASPGPPENIGVHDLQRGNVDLYQDRPPRVGVVVATFAAVPYIHLHLANWRRHFPEIPLLVSDDGSPFRDRLKELCAEYGAGFVCNERRLRRTVGDMSAYMHGFLWSKEAGIDLLVKMSRRFIPCYNWVTPLIQLATETQMPTFSQCCDHFNFGFRTECIGFHCASWRASGGFDKISEYVRRNEPIFIEGFIHELARAVAKEHACPRAEEYMRDNPRPPDRNGYAPWLIMPDRRTTRTPQLLWHDCDGPFDYCRAANLYGLNYCVQDFEDPNQGCGLGEP